MSSPVKLFGPGKVRTRAESSGSRRLSALLFSVSGSYNVLKLAILAFGILGTFLPPSGEESLLLLLIGKGDSNSFNASNAQGPEIRITATAVAPPPTDAPPPPDESANIVSSSVDIVSSSLVSSIVNDDNSDFDGCDVDLWLLMGEG
jgi:hypothetical protein